MGEGTLGEVGRGFKGPVPFAVMPVIVVGGDHVLGEAIIAKVHQPGREVRAFVSSPAAAERLRAAGVKAALGDVSDASHVAGACRNCFSAVLVSQAASDGREISFARSTEEVWQGWVEATKEAGVRRLIWISDSPPPPGGAEEIAVVKAGERSTAEIAEEVAALDDALHLPR